MDSGEKTGLEADLNEDLQTGSAGFSARVIQRHLHLPHLHLHLYLYYLGRYPSNGTLHAPTAIAFAPAAYLTRSLIGSPPPRQKRQLGTHRRLLQEAHQERRNSLPALFYRLLPEDRHLGKFCVDRPPGHQPELPL